MTIKKGVDRMNKVYLILDDEPLDRRSLTLVENEKHAKLLCEHHSRFDYYEEIDLMNENDVADIILDNLWSNMGEKEAKEKVKELFPDYEVYLND